MSQTNELLSQQVALLLAERQATAVALQAAGQHSLMEAIAQPTPVPAVDCVVETIIEAILETPVPKEAPKPAPFIAATPGGRVALPGGFFAAGRMSGKQYVPTPSDGSGLDPTRSNPY